MENQSVGLFQQIAQVAGLDLSAVTLVGIWVFCFGLAKRLLGSGPRHDRGRQDLARLAGKLSDRLTKFYDESVKLMLLFVDKWAGDRYLEMAGSGHPKRFHPFNNPSPWSNGIYDLTLRLALLYPLLFVLVGWVWSGQSAPGLENFLPSETEGWLRALLVPAGAVVLFCIFRSLRAAGWRSLL